MKTFEGNLIGNDLSFAIVISRFNELFSGKLFEGSMDALLRHGVSEKKITKIIVPGAFEIPLAAKTAAESGNFNAVICLGAVIRGATSHYDLVSGEAAKGIAQISLDTGVPVIFGILTTENLEQAIERSGSKAGNKGFEAAVSAIEMANLVKCLKSH